MAINGSIYTLLNILHTSELDLTTPTESLGSFAYNIRDGDDANQMNLLWHDQRTISGSSSEDLDLRGSLTDAFGTTVNFADVRLIIVKSSSDNSTGSSDYIQVGGAASNAFINWVGSSTDKVQIRAGGLLLLYAPTDEGYDVTGGTADILTISNTDGNNATYDIYIGGTST